MDEDNRRQVLDEIVRREAAGEFDCHVDPVDWSLALPVDGNFPYIPHGFLRLKYAFEGIYVRNFQKKANRELLRTEFHGTEHFRGIPSAILTCNHVNKFDCLALKEAAKGHRVYVVGAKFNNMKGFLGEMMRAGGMLPLSDNIEAMKNLNRAVGHYLSKGNYVAVYPEQAMWWNYEKPRPFKDGAFTFAVKYRVPVIPCFITFRHTGIFDANGVETKYLTLHVMEPLYPDLSKPRHQAVEELRDRNYAACCAKYEEVYGRPVVYETGGN